MIAILFTPGFRIGHILLVSQDPLVFDPPDYEIKLERKISKFVNSASDDVIPDLEEHITKAVL